MLFSAGKPGAGVGEFYLRLNCWEGKLAQSWGSWSRLILSCSEPSSTKIKMYEGVCVLARVCVNMNDCVHMCVYAFVCARRDVCVCLQITGCFFGTQNRMPTI